MNVLEQLGVEYVYHYSPLHYLPFIGRAGALFSKPALAASGFGPTHLRSKSSRSDIARGFGDCGFLTLDPSARILNAKLAAGFPHIAFEIPSAALTGASYCLSRYNIAMTRYLRRGQTSGFPESSSNGRYYKSQQVPVAKTESDKKSMLAFHLPKGTMIEILIYGNLPLPDNTKIICYAERDAHLANTILQSLNVDWQVKIKKPLVLYKEHKVYMDAVLAFIDQAISDPYWRGNGLEFDRV